MIKLWSYVWEREWFNVARFTDVDWAGVMANPVQEKCILVGDFHRNCLLKCFLQNFLPKKFDDKTFLGKYFLRISKSQSNLP